jgi:hypothetical protein
MKSKPSRRQSVRRSQEQQILKSKGVNSNAKQHQYEKLDPSVCAFVPSLVSVNTVFPVLCAYQTYIS